MTTPQDKLNTMGDDAKHEALMKHLRALPQVEPSAELDAAILNKIEQALQQEAQQQAQQKNLAAVEKTAQAPRQHFFRSLEQTLKQFWFVPVGAMALLVATVSLHSPESPSALGNLPTASQETAKANEVNKPLKQDASTSSDNTLPATLPPTNGQVIARAEQPSTFDSKKMASDIAMLTEKKTRERMAARTSSAKAAKAEETKLALSEELRTRDDKKNRPDQAQNREVTSPISDARAIDISRAIEEKPKQISPSPAIVANYASGTFEAKANAARDVANKGFQRVEITGSSIKRMDVESSNAVQSLTRSENTEDRIAAKTELYAVKEVYEPNIRLSQADQALAKAVAPEARMPAAPPAPAAAKTAPVEAINPPHNIAPQAPIEAPRFSVATQTVDVISVKLEQLIKLGRPMDALQLWKDFKENYPQSRLPPELQKKMDDLEHKQKSKK